MDVQVSHTGDWSHGLCGCFDNAGLCILSFFCPGFVFGQNAKHVGEDCIKMGVCFLLPVSRKVEKLSGLGVVQELRS